MQTVQREARSFTSLHAVDADGMPAGGFTEGVGFRVDWQDGPLNAGGVRRKQSGAFVEHLIEAVIDRIEFYQSSKFQSDFNVDTLAHLRAALESQQARTRDRIRRGVEGTHQL